MIQICTILDLIFDANILKANCILPPRPLQTLLFSSNNGGNNGKHSFKLINLFSAFKNDLMGHFFERTQTCTELYLTNTSMDWTFFMLTFEKLTVSFQDLLKNLMAHLLSFNNGKKNTFIYF